MGDPQMPVLQPVTNTFHVARVVKLPICKLSCLKVSKQERPVFKFSPHNPHFLLNGDKTDMRLWKIGIKQENDERVVGEKIHKTENVTAVAWTVDGKHFATGDHLGYIRVFDLEGKLERFFRAQVTGIQILKYHPEGKFILNVSIDYKLRLINLVTGNVTQISCNHRSTLHGIDWTVGMGFFSSSGKLILWQTVGVSTRTYMRDHRFPIVKAVYDPHTNQVASCDRKGGLLLTLNGANAYNHRLLGHNGTIFDIEWVPKGRTLISFGANLLIRVWDGQTTEMMKEFHVRNAISSLSISSDGEFLAGGCLSGKIYVISIKAGVVTTTFHDPEVISNRIKKVEWSCDGQSLVASTFDGAILVFRFTKTQL